MEYSIIVIKHFSGMNRRVAFIKIVNILFKTEVIRLINTSLIAMGEIVYSNFKGN